MRATKEGLASQEEGPIAIDAGTDRGDLELKLDAGAELAFRLVTATDAPVNDVEARFQTAGRRQAPRIRRSARTTSTTTRSCRGGRREISDQVARRGDVRPDARAAGFRGRGAGRASSSGAARRPTSARCASRNRRASPAASPTPNGQPIAGPRSRGCGLPARRGSRVRPSRAPTAASSSRAWATSRSATCRCAPPATPSASREERSPAIRRSTSRSKRPAASWAACSSRAARSRPAFRVQAFPEAKEKQERPGFRMVISNRPGRGPDLHRPFGSFRLDGVDAGHGHDHGEGRRQGAGRKSGLKVVSDQVADAGTLILQDGRALRGRVVAAKDDAPIPGATVSVAPPQGFMMSRSAATRPASRSRGSTDGSRSQGSSRARTPSMRPAGLLPQLGPRRDRRRRRHGRFRRSSCRAAASSPASCVTRRKRPCRTSQVLLTKMRMGGGPQTASTGPDGRYSFEKVAPGEYMVIRAPAGGGPLMLFGGMKQVVVREGRRRSTISTSRPRSTSRAAC